MCKAARGSSEYRLISERARSCDSGKGLWFKESTCCANIDMIVHGTNIHINFAMHMTSRNDMLGGGFGSLNNVSVSILLRRIITVMKEVQLVR